MFAGLDGDGNVCTTEFYWDVVWIDYFLTELTDCVLASTGSVSLDLLLLFCRESILVLFVTLVDFEDFMALLEWELADLVEVDFCSEYNASLFLGCLLGKIFDD